MTTTYCFLHAKGGGVKPYECKAVAGCQKLGALWKNESCNIYSIYVAKNWCFGTGNHQEKPNTTKNSSLIKCVETSFKIASALK